MNSTTLSGVFWLGIDYKLIEELAAIGTIISLIVGLIIGYFRYKPKSNNTAILEYLDSKTNLVVQKHEHIISWGWGKICCLNEIYLQEFSEKANYRISYKPFTAYEKPLSKKYFSEQIKNRNMTLRLVVRCLFGKCFTIKEIKKIFVMTYLPNEIDYDASITVSHQPRVIEISNDNSLEIRNYKICLPIGTTMDKLNNSIKEIQEIHVDDGMPTGLTIKLIPASDGNNPGKVIIIL